MEISEIYSLHRRAEEFAQSSLLAHDRFGLADKAFQRSILEAQSHARIANEFLTGIGGIDRVRELTVGFQEWQRNERIRELIEGSSSALARAAQGHIDSPTMRAAMGYLDSLLIPAES